MVHKMNLDNKPFNMIKNGCKDIEMRLYDEKRQNIKKKDIIEFTNRLTNETIKREVINLHICDTFKKLYDTFDKTRLGYLKEETASYVDMEKYYSKEDIYKYGVVGIEISTYDSVSVNYFCSGFNKENAFFESFAQSLKKDLKNTKQIVYIPGGNSEEKIARTINEKIPEFTNHFKKIGIIFENVKCITNDISKEEAIKLVKESSMVFLLGGNPFLQKELFESKGLKEVLKNYDGVILGISAGAMNMSKYIIVTPCSDEYPNFDIRPGLNLSNISIYPHNNFKGNIFPKKIYMGDEVTHSKDLLKVSNEYGSFYCLQDYYRDDGLTDVSIIRTYKNKINIITENDGKVWEVRDNNFNLIKEN